jgi:tetratricopeptide (TPR) repeat protein
MWHYARGRALAARGDVAAAEAELAQVHAAAADPGLAEARLEFNAAGAVLGVAIEVLAGHVAAARGDHGGAIAHLREAVRREDELTYGEPPEWLPERGADAGELLSATAELLFDHSLFNGHPRFFGYITSSPAPIGMLGDFLAAAVNANVGSWRLGSRRPRSRRRRSAGSPS